MAAQRRSSGLWMWGVASVALLGVAWGCVGGGQAGNSTPPPGPTATPPGQQDNPPTAVPPAPTQPMVIIIGGGGGPTPTATTLATATVTPSPTATAVPSVTATATVTETATVPATATGTPSGTATATETPTATATESATAAPTVTETQTPTETPTATATATVTASATATASATPTATETPTPTATASATPTSTATPTATATPTPTPTALVLSLPGGGSMTLVSIPAGTFTMGSPAGEQDRDADEGPQRVVTISQPFFMGQTEVTQAQWKAVMGVNPSNFAGDDTRPVDSIGWDDTQVFCRALATLTGQAVRLPTEAEWEYAARAGTTTRFHWGDDAGYAQIGTYAWYTSNSSASTHAVGQLQANPWGLYDMAGNVLEWCQDWYHSSYTSAPTDGSAWETPAGTDRVLRGGSWRYFGRHCRSASRHWGLPPRRDDMGLRVVVGGSAPSATPPAMLYVANRFAGGVASFRRADSGNVPPTTVLAGTTTGLASGISGPTGLAFNAAGELIVSTSTGGTIRVYAPGSGDVAPRRVVTGVTNPTGLLYVGATDTLYVADYSGQVLRFANVSQSTFDGNATRTVVADVATSGLQNPYGLALDSQGALYIANQGANTVTVITNPGTVTGPAAAARVLTNVHQGVRAGLSSIAIDANDVLYASASNGSGIPSANDTALLRYPNCTALSGAVTAASVLEMQGSGPSGQFLLTADGTCVVPSGNRVLFYDNVATRSGLQAPDRTIEGASTQLDRPACVALRTDW